MLRLVATRAGYSLKQSAWSTLLSNRYIAISGKNRARISKIFWRRGGWQWTGPIVEIGTLYGRTATHMALFKEPSQKIITVDCYVWNPLGLPPDSHYQLTAQVLHYLVETGHVEQRRMDKNPFYATYDGPSPALVFLDADHTYEETNKDA